MYIPRRKANALEERPAWSEDEQLEEELKDIHKEDVPEFLRSRSSIERMEAAAGEYSDKAQAMMTKLMAGMQPDVIDREVLLNVVEIQRKRSIGCVSLPISLFFFGIFAFSSFQHEDPTNVFIIESGLREAFSDGIDEVNTIPDIWTWLDNQLLPKVFNQRNLLGDPIPEERKEEWSRVLGYNRLQGPLVLEQLRSPRQPCDDSGPSRFMTCYPQFAKGKDPIEGRGFTCEDLGISDLSPMCEYYMKSFRVSPDTSRRLHDNSHARMLRTMRTEYMGRLPLSKPDGDAFRVHLYPNTPYASILNHTRFIRENAWIDEQTKMLKVTAMLLNAEVGRPRLEKLQIIFAFSRGGGMFVRVTFDTLFLKMWSGSISMFADFVFLVMLMVFTGLELNHLRKANKKKQFCATLRKPWSILQGLIITGGWFIMFGYARTFLLLGAVQTSFNEVVESRNVDAEENVVGQIGTNLHHDAENLLAFAENFRFLVAEYHLLLMFRFFTAFHAQPRLGVVVSTLESSLLDIVHFLVVLMPTFVAYAISGMFVFGRRMQEFSTIAAAVGNCFKMAMEGEYDWPKLSEEFYWTSALWVWSFMLLIVLLLLNMVLAIVMDVYTEMRRTSVSSESVGATIAHLFTQLRMWRNWVSNKDLSERLKDMSRHFSREELSNQFPKMCEQQLSYLCNACRHQVEVDLHKGMELKDSMKMTMAIKLSVDQVNESVGQLKEGSLDEYEESISLLASDENKGWLQSIATDMAQQNHWMLQIQWQLQQLQWQWDAVEAVHGPGAHFDVPAKVRDPRDDVIL